MDNPTDGSYYHGRWKQGRSHGKDGEYKLAARAPGNAEELAASKKAKTQETWEKKRAMGAAAAVLASLASAPPE